jgi:tetratricopeptide (TPR) repeat protein
MSDLHKTLVCLIGLLVPFAACTKAINEKDVFSVIETLDRAANNKNADTIVAQMAPTARVTMSIQGSSQYLDISMDAAKYLVYLKQGFSHSDKYELTRKDTRVSMSSDGKSAIVSGRTIEKVTARGLTIITESPEMMVLEKQDEAIVITSIESGRRPWALDPDHSLKVATEAFQGKDYRDALWHFRAAVAGKPASATAYTLLGTTAELLGEFDEALEAYKNSVMTGQSSEGYFRLGMLAEQMGEPSLAIEWLKKSIAIGEGGDSRVREYLFRTLIENGDQAGALKLARDSAWVGKKITDYCAHQPGLKVSKETQALLAMLIRPDRADCLLDVGIALTDDGLVRLARVTLMDRMKNSSDKQVREKAAWFLSHRLPDHDIHKRAEALNIVGYNLQNAIEKGDLAIEVYKKAIAADPTFSWPYHNIGRVYFNRLEMGPAKEWYSKAVAVNPNHWKAQFNLGWLCLNLKQYDQALAAFRHAVKLNRFDAPGHANLGRTLFELGEDQEALQELEVAIQLDPKIREYPGFPNDKLAGRNGVSGARGRNGGKNATF